MKRLQNVFALTVAEQRLLLFLLSLLLVCAAVKTYRASSFLPRAGELQPPPSPGTRP